MKRLFFSFLSIALCAFAAVSCEKDNKDDNGGEKGRQAGTYLPYSQQQEIVAQTITGSLDKIDFSPVSEVVKNIYARTRQRFDLGSVLSILAQEEGLQPLVSVVAQYIVQPEIEIEFEKFYLKAAVEIQDSTRLDGEKVSVLILDSISYDNDCLDLDIKMDGHNYCIKLKGTNASGAAIDYQTYETSKNKVVYLPKTINLTASCDEKPILSLDLELNSDMTFHIINADEQSDTEFSYDGSKADLSAVLNLNGTEFDTKVAFDASKGLGVSVKCSAGNTAIAAVDAKLDASLSALNGFDKSSLIEWAMDPQQLRKLDCGLTMGNDDIKIVASVENPFKDQEFIQALLQAITATSSSDKYTKLIEMLNKYVDNLNELIKCEIYFKGFNEPQARLKFTQVESVQGESLLNSLLGFASIVTFDDKGEEVTIPLMEYLGNTSLLSQINNLGVKVINELMPIIRILRGNIDDYVIKTDISSLIGTE